MCQNICYTEMQRIFCDLFSSDRIRRKVNRITRVLKALLNRVTMTESEEKNGIKTGES